MGKKKGQVMHGSVTLQSNLADLIAAKAKRQGEEITISQISRDTKLAMNTVKRYLRGGDGVFDGRAVAILCRYLECEVGDLLKVVEIAEGQNAGQSPDSEN
jgi:DNA-binding Xre family transcriptional regulator